MKLCLRLLALHGRGRHLSQAPVGGQLCARISDVDRAVADHQKLTLSHVFVEQKSAVIAIRQPLRPSTANDPVKA